MSLERPPWISGKIRPGACREVEAVLEETEVNTVCREACCPNMGECFRERTATFMILGRICTRRCLFCAVTKGAPPAPEPGEAERVAAAACQLGLKHVVITSVTRDDLSDGGAWLFALTVRKVKERLPGVNVEVLVPDFGGDLPALRKVLHAKPDIFNHNIETVPRLYGRVRPGADYGRSLRVLKEARTTGLIVKSGLMVGLGEKREEIDRVVEDLLLAGCSILTVGQYLSPTSAHLPVTRYYTPEEFALMKESLLSRGFKNVLASPLVRSSYRAGEAYTSDSV